MNKEEIKKKYSKEIEGIREYHRSGCPDCEFEEACWAYNVCHSGWFHCAEKNFDFIYTIKTMVNEFREWREEMERYTHACDEEAERNWREMTASEKAAVEAAYRKAFPDDGRTEEKIAPSSLSVSEF